MLSKSQTDYIPFAIFTIHTLGNNVMFLIVPLRLSSTSSLINDLIIPTMIFVSNKHHLRLPFLDCPLSLKDIAFACSCERTTGPVLLPECSVPCFHLCISVFTTLAR